MANFLDITNRNNTPRRLDELRKRATATGAPDWRHFRASCMDIERHEELCAGQQSNGARIWYTHGDEPFRNERYADDVDGAHIDHTGWFVNDEQDEKTRGIVGRLTHGRFIAGYEDAGGARVYFDRVHDDEREEARAADREAEIVADNEREYNARWMAANALDDKIAEVSRNVARMFKLRHTDGFDSAADYRELEDGIAELRRLKDELANYSDIER